jgi:hypothetical protein
VSLEEPQTSDAGTAAETERLHARIAELEAELVEVEAWANRAVAVAQDRTYWLDRWHVDLNALMERPGAAEFRAALRAIRAIFRTLSRLRRRVRAST